MNERQKIEQIYRNYEGIDFVVPETNHRSTGLPKAERTLTPVERYLRREHGREGGRRIPDLPNDYPLTRAQIGRMIIKAI